VPLLPRHKGAIFEHRRRFQPAFDLARVFNPYIRGWINYYSHFYKSAMYPTLRRIDAFLVRWARRKLKRLQRPKCVRVWLARVVRSSPNLFAHWPLLYGQGRTLRRMTRERHIRFLERVGVRLLRASPSNSQSRFLVKLVASRRPRCRAGQPEKQRIVVDPLDQLPLRADRVAPLVATQALLRDRRKWPMSS
jgi:hypothetical protein